MEAIFPFFVLQVACTWEDVKSLRQDMEKSQSSSNVHFRSKVLQAVEQMQVSGIQVESQHYVKLYFPDNSNPSDSRSF